MILLGLELTLSYSVCDDTLLCSGEWEGTFVVAVVLTLKLENE
jgi:hypothetical protein